MSHIIRPLLVGGLLVVGLASSACGPPQHQAAHSEAAPAVARASASPVRSAEDDRPPLYDDLGDHQRKITTSSDLAQAYFDQGLRLHYAFNHAEALRSYETALEEDPDCAMCWWGIALSSGHNINGAMSDEEGRRAYQAAVEAGRRSADVTGSERALIEALATRYGPDPAVDRVKLDSAYAAAMGHVAEAYPDDDDALTLYAASLMNLSPWYYWDGPYADRTPRPGTLTILSTLERALEINRDHPGACHYLIHAVEAAYPERAVECADRLAALMPGAGHIVHMPGHIYIRVGRYADAVQANRHAVHEDETYIQDQGLKSVYTGAYYPHNYHFMAFAATMGGMKDAAVEAATKVASRVPLEVAQAVYFIQNAVVMPQLTYVSFGEWEAVLGEPAPDPSLSIASAVDMYTRGTALAALGRADEARGILGKLRANSRAASAEIDESNPAMPVLAIAPLALAGEIALRTGQPEAAAARFREAVLVEDEMLYEEPPLWYYPLRQSLGQALLEAGDATGAEDAYRRDLERFPHNGWSLYGLAQALEAQERHEEAEAIREEFEEAWKNSDVELTGSRF